MRFNGSTCSSIVEQIAFPHSQTPLTHAQVPRCTRCPGHQHKPRRILLMKRFLDSPYLRYLIPPKPPFLPEAPTPSRATFANFSHFSDGSTNSRPQPLIPCSLATVTHTVTPQSWLHQNVTQFGHPNCRGDSFAEFRKKNMGLVTMDDSVICPTTMADTNGQESAPQCGSGGGQLPAVLLQHG